MSATMLASMKRMALLAIVLMGAACGSIGAQAHTISLAYKAGDTYTYGLHVVLKYTLGAQGLSMPLNLELSAKETMNVKSVDSAGTADIALTVSNVAIKTTVNGTTNSTNTTNSTTVDMKVASDGRIVSINGNALGSSALPGLSGTEGGLVTAILPDHAVKPGDTWSKSYDEPNPLGSGTVHATSDNKYLRDEKVGSVNAAVVESKVNTNLALTMDLASLLGQSGGTALPTGAGSGGIQGLAVKGTSVSDITSWIDTSARRVVKTHSTGTVDATLTINMAAGSTTPGLAGPLTFKGTQTLDLTPA